MTSASQYLFPGDSQSPCERVRGKDRSYKYNYRIGFNGKNGTLLNMGLPGPHQEARI